VDAEKPYMADFKATVKLCMYLMPIDQGFSYQMLTVF